MREDISGWQVRLTDSLIKKNSRSGIWRNKTISDLLEIQAVQQPDKILVIDGEKKVTASQLYDMGRSLAFSLKSMGLSEGDVISFQLPNWYEVLVIDMAASFLGLVCNPIIPIYREAEVTYILKDAGTRVFFVPTEFRVFDYITMIENHRGELPNLDYIVTVRGNAEECVDWKDLTNIGESNSLNKSIIDPNSVKLIMYTSGTTGQPKGVLHSHNTIDTENQAFRKFLNLGSEDVILMPLSLIHI